MTAVRRGTARSTCCWCCPAIGILVIETKGGPIVRDGFGRWYAGQPAPEPPPFEQAETSARAMARKIEADPRWRGELRTIHAVAFPDTDRDSLAREGRTLGPDAPAELILDRSDLATDEAAARRARPRDALLDRRRHP